MCAAVIGSTTSARISLRHFATIRRSASVLNERDPKSRTLFHLPKTFDEKLYINYIDRW